jgi:hypothetical protein
MFGDRHSLLSLGPLWQPVTTGPGYALKDFVTYALGRQRFSER